MGVLFNDRTALGKTLATGLQQYRGKDAVVLCLKEKSLLTSVAVAAELRAWVYPLLSSPVYSQDLSRRLLGAYAEDGAFCVNPDGIEASVQDLPPDLQVYVENQKTTALEDIKNQAAKFEMTFSKQSMDGRDVIIVGDVITSALPLAVASHLLSTIRPKSFAVAIGNTTPKGAAMARLLAEEPIILDVISGVVLDDEHYFEHDDAYDEEQKYALTQYIASYWR
jgi:predicted phosphoribosyltransferase